MVPKVLASAFLRANGWSAVGERPAARRFVLIAAPHTSNWDLPYLLALATHFDLRVSWLGKRELFRPPLGPLLRRLGGIPVVRDKRMNLVAQAAARFKDSDELALVVPAEGTRSRVEHWKSGFYHIAREANVPIVPGFLDYARREGGFGAPFHVSGDVRKDMDRVRAFYADKTGKHPALFGAIRLLEED